MFHNIMGFHNLHNGMWIFNNIVRSGRPKKTTIVPLKVSWEKPEMDLMGPNKFK
jgi:hypothetical protein